MDLDYNPYCELFNGTFTGLFHGSALIFGAAFSIPQNFELGLLVLRTLGDFLNKVIIFYKSQ